MEKSRKRIAVIGGGISGLSAAWQLNKFHDVVLYEAEKKVGGHAYTHDIMIDNVNFPLDLGVVIISEKSSAAFFELIKLLNVKTHAVTLSFVATFDDNTSWNNHQCNSQLWQDIKGECDRFIVDMNEVSNTSNQPVYDITLGEFLIKKNYSTNFIYKGLIPLLSLIAACRSSLLETNVRNCALYFSNHRLSFFNPTLFRAFPGGTYSYVSTIYNQLQNNIRLNTKVISILRNSGEIIISNDSGVKEKYDEVVIATQANIAVSLLKDIREEEREALTQFSYEDAVTLFHTDNSSVMSSQTKHLIHYNGFLNKNNDTIKGTVSIDLNYYLEQLGVGTLDRQYIATVQPAKEIQPDKILDIRHWKHTSNQADLSKIRKMIGQLQGKNHTWFCGADTSFAAHGYACASGFVIAEELGVPYPFIEKPWVIEERSLVRSMMGI